MIGTGYESSKPRFVRTLKEAKEVIQQTGAWQWIDGDIAAVEVATDHRSIISYLNGEGADVIVVTQYEVTTKGKIVEEATDGPDGEPFDKHVD